jgi:MoxR-like ATPase
LALLLDHIPGIQARLAEHGYLADDGLATALFLAARLPQPLLLEGEAGVGKSELGRTLAQAYGIPFIRLQCYEGLEAREALYEWNYLRQLLAIRQQEGGRGAGEIDLFDDRFLIARPLLRALQESPCVLLIDELDRADEAFEAFLLEFLSDYAITIPERGRVAAVIPPIVIITSNRTRELHDALKRRCLYHWVGYPSPEQELAIIRAREPQVAEGLAAALVGAVRWLRGLDLQKPPGVAETLAWVRAAHALGEERASAALLERTLGVVVKNHDDMERVLAARGSGWPGEGD